MPPIDVPSLSELEHDDEPMLVTPSPVPSTGAPTPTPTLGVRVHAIEPRELTAGQYGKWLNDGNWYGVPPDTTLLAGFACHEVVEHEDGSITVSPSIAVNNGAGGQSWHGYLERGTWRLA